MSSEPPLEYAPTQAGVAAMERHTKLVAAAHEAIDTLEASFAPGDFIPGAIEDAIAALRAGLERAPTDA